MKPKVLVVAADQSLRAAVNQILRPEGYLVELAANEGRTRELLETGEIDAAIVAPSSLGVRGLQLASELQSTVDHVIVLADDAGDAERLAGSLPGVVVLPQPLDRFSLLRRLSTLLAAAAGGRDDPGPSELLSFDGRIVDLAGRDFYDADGSKVFLTRAEFELLATFVRQTGRVLSRDRLRDAVSGRSSEPYDRSIDMLVGRLRRKVEPDPKNPRFILTVPGVGYKFEARLQRTQPPPTSVVPHRQSPEFVISYFERRQMTVLACQISGFATRTAKHDPEDVHAATRSAYQTIEKIVKPFGGKVMPTPVDSLLVYFGYPEAHEDDVGAVRAALELVRSLPSKDVGLSTRLHLRIGIATGEMLVGNMDMWQSSPPVGESLNLALHLRSVAPVDGVVIAVGTHERVGEFFDFEELTVALEGDTVPAWHVTGENVVGRFDALRRAEMLDLVDRNEQTELLQRRWEQAKRGSGQVVMLTGEPGIGKSRLLAEFEQSATVCLKYFGLPHQTDASMFAIISELSSACRFGPDDSASVKLGMLEATLYVAGIDDSRSVALISDLLSLPAESSASLAQLTPYERKKETFAALLNRIKGLAAGQPVLVIVEDIQWIDPASLEFLALVVEHVHALPVLMLIAARPEFAPPWPGHAHITVSELARLTQSDSELLLERVVGDRNLPKKVAEQILVPTEGVPLFIEEFTKTVLETAVTQHDEEPREFDHGPVQVIPRTLRGSLHARLNRLGPAREVAQIGAVIGREFSYELLRAVANKPEAELGIALKQLGESELVYGRGAPPLATYMFKHALVRDAAYGMLLRARRNELHGAIARALEETFPEIGRAQPELLAHHYQEAGNVEKAVSYLSIAGGLALSRSALTEAYRQITQALQLIVTLPEGDSRRREELKLRIALARTLLEQKGYADIEVGDAYAKAADLSKRVDDAGMQLAVHYGLWAHHYIGGQPEAMLKEGAEFLVFAQRRNAVGAIVTGHRLVGTAHLINGEVKKANTALDKALAQYDPREHGAASPVGQELRASFGQDVGVTVYSYRSWARWLTGRPDQAADAAAKALASGRASGHRHSLFYALWHAGMAKVMLRDEAEVARLGSELSQYANERALPYWQALGHFLQGWHARHSGHPSDAIERLRLGLELWEQRGSRVFRPVCMAFLAEAYTADDQPKLARATFEEALKIAADTGERWAEPEIHRLFGDLLVRDGDSPTAIARYEQAIAIARRQGSRSFELRATMSLARISRDKDGSIRERLSNIYQTFNEGLSTADLSDARAMLAAGAVPQA